MRRATCGSVPASSGRHTPERPGGHTGTARTSGTARNRSACLRSVGERIDERTCTPPPRRLGAQRLGRRSRLQQLRHAHRPRSPREVVHAALDAGVTLFDTSDSYGDVGGVPRRDPRGSPSRGRPGDEVRHGPARRQRPGLGCARLAALHPPCRRALAATPAHGLDRPLPDPLPRPPDADRGDPRGARRPRPRGQGPLRRLAPTSPAGRSPTPTGRLDTRGLERFITAQNRLQPARPAHREASSCPPPSASAIGLLPYFPLASGLLTGKYRRGDGAARGRRGSPSGAWPHRR